MEPDFSTTEAAAGFSLRDILVFTAIVALATACFVRYDRLGYFPFLGAIYFAGWRLLNINASRTNRIVMMAFAIAMISPLLLWYSSPEQRAFNMRIGYRWSGSFLYPFCSLLPIPFLSFIWKCFRPKLTTLRFVLESCGECLFLIPVYSLFVPGI